MQAKHGILVVTVIVLLIGILAAFLFFHPADTVTTSEPPMPLKVAVDFRISNSTVSVLDTRMEYGYGPEYIRGPFSADVIGSNADVIYSVPIMDPRIRLGETVVYIDNQDFTVVVPFRPDMERMILSDQTTSEQLASVYLGDAITRFCRLHDTDSECGKFLNRTG